MENSKNTYQMFSPIDPRISLLSNSRVPLDLPLPVFGRNILDLPLPSFAKDILDVPLPAFGICTIISSHVYEPLPFPKIKHDEMMTNFYQFSTQLHHLIRGTSNLVQEDLPQFIVKPTDCLAEEDPSSDVSMDWCNF